MVDRDERRKVPLTFQGDHFTLRIHNRGIRSNRSLDRICRIGHVDDDDKGGILNFFSHANKFIGFHGKRTKTDVGNVNSDILKLQEKVRSDRIEKAFDFTWRCS